VFSISRQGPKIQRNCAIPLNYEVSSDRQEGTGRATKSTEGTVSKDKFVKRGSPVAARTNYIRIQTAVCPKNKGGGRGGKTLQHNYEEVHYERRIKGTIEESLDKTTANAPGKKRELAPIKNGSLTLKTRP